ncbi:MAG: hypothetical protein NWE89_13165 [Candidatus Bathyarchaeota archaeon]|nr:hypothetical protein [Candidatus Bathyarchaeota archaeon]
MSLNTEAHGILKETGLLEILSTYGRAEVVGSVALDLIVKLDIDIHVLVENPELIETVNMIYPRLLEHPNIAEMRISDYRPDGVKIGVDRYPATSGDWSIDIWVTNKIESTAFQYVLETTTRLDEKNRAR